MGQAYPFIRFFVSYARPLAVMVTAIVLIAGIVAVMAGLPAWVLVVAIVLAAVLFPLMCLLGELVALIADTLLPQ